MIKTNEVTDMIQNVANGLVEVLKSLIILFVFAGILYTDLPNSINVIGGLTNLIDRFVNGGFNGLLALLVLFSFMKK